MQPGSGPIEDHNYQLVNLICSRLLGDRASYAPDLIDEPSVIFGATAFRRLALDLTPNGLIAFLNEVSELPVIRQSHINTLAMLGPYMETMLTVQYWAYKGALDALPEIITDYDLTTFIEIGKQALPHFDTLSHNGSLTEIGPPTHQSLLMDTFQGLANTLQSTGNLESTLAEYGAELAEISMHLTAIASVWETAGLHLSTLLGKNPTPVIVSIAIGGSIILCVALVGLFFYQRRVHTSDNPGEQVS
jgi:hypothetical protein